KAATSAASGNLDIDLMYLANSRGEVKVDLTTLSTTTFGDKEKDDKQTMHARTWLEAVVDGKVSETYRYAVYAIRSIDNVSATDLSKVAATKDTAGGDLRTVTLTSHGDFLIHGKKMEKAVKLEAKFHYPAGAAADS